MRHSETELQEMARADLEQYTSAKRQIEHNQERLIRLELRINRVNMELNPNKVSVQSSNDAYASLIDEKIDLEYSIKAEQIDAERLCIQIDRRISRLRPRLYSRILRNFWLDDMPMKEIAVNEHMSLSGCYYHHNEALLEYGKMLADSQII